MRRAGRGEQCFLWEAWVEHSHKLGPAFFVVALHTYFRPPLLQDVPGPVDSILGTRLRAGILRRKASSELPCSVGLGALSAWHPCLNGICGPCVGIYVLSMVSAEVVNLRFTTSAAEMPLTTPVINACRCQGQSHLDLEALH